MKYKFFLFIYLLFSCNSDNNIIKSNKEISSIIDTDLISISNTFHLNGKRYLKLDSSLVNGEVEIENKNSYSNLDIQLHSCKVNIPVSETSQLVCIGFLKS